ncbi:DUF2867 domain-containing protein [Marinomonas colpomeniae]|uniref:DUF2867 domain-containing protein n=1 Tax=Marinomonas colpomeniae TaxID=2774408 RepID=A0ABR8NUA3_9GAMM|nr:DUF2867 domain-containing protein [Marinomonas colpomeniae]MBD5769628.1 DUF2867 domain-containing protein [Marinomonas colpomeniae]
MQRVTSSKLPLQSALHDRIKPMDFIDCYCIESDLPTRNAAEIITNFPAWAQFLVRIRNVITAPLGLLKEAPTTGDKVGFFPVESESDDEIIAGFNDKHLDFRVSVISQNGKVFLATWVHTNNMVGQLYLKVILPFHILIVRNALARVRKENNNILR